MVSLRNVTIHITGPDDGRLRQLTEAIVTLIMQYPDLVFEIGVTQAEEAP